MLKELLDLVPRLPDGCVARDLVGAPSAVYRILTGHMQELPRRALFDARRRKGDRYRSGPEVWD